MEKRLKLLGSAYKSKQTQHKPAELHDRLFDTAAKNPGKLTSELLEALKEIKIFSANIQNHTAEFFSTFISPDFIRMSIEGLSLEDACKENIETKVEFIWIWCNLSITSDPRLLFDIWTSGLVEAAIGMMENSLKYHGLIEDGFRFLTHMLHQPTEGAHARFVAGRFDDRLSNIFQEYFVKFPEEDMYLRFYSNYLFTVLSYKPVFGVEQIKRHFSNVLDLIATYKAYENQDYLAELLRFFSTYMNAQSSHDLTLAYMSQTSINLIGLLKRHEYRDIQNLVARILICLFGSDNADSLADVS